MEIKRYKIGENEFEFVCESWSNSRAWGHKVTLLKNGIEWAENKVRYYNRTWETFQYQTCMLGAIRTEMDKIIDNGINDYKYNNNITRFKKGEKDKVIENIKGEKNYKVFEKLYEAIYHGNRQGGEI